MKGHPAAWTQQVLFKVCFCLLAAAGTLLIGSCASHVLVVENSRQLLAENEYELATADEIKPEQQRIIVNRLLKLIEHATEPPLCIKEVNSEKPGGRTEISSLGHSTSLENKSTSHLSSVVDSRKENSERLSLKDNPDKVVKQQKAPLRAPASEVSGDDVSMAMMRSEQDMEVEEEQKNVLLEDTEGRRGRRPLRDPFRIGESVTLEVSYFGVVAGELTLKIEGLVENAGRKAYKIGGHAQSSSFFSMFYAVDDSMETNLDYETLLPTSYAVHVREAVQLREIRNIFDFKNLRATTWDRRVNKEKKLESQKYDWRMFPLSQNIFSSAYYFRIFALRPGKKIQFRLAHDNENLIVTGNVIRREVLSTPIGDLNTLVMQPIVQIDGVFRPVGDITFWVTDDDQKILVRIESKIQIGSIVGMVKELNRGVKGAL